MRYDRARKNLDRHPTTSSPPTWPPNMIRRLAVWVVPIAQACKGVLMPLRTRTQWWGVVLDAPDGPELARFYARLLGWRVFSEGERGAAVAPSENAGYNLAFETAE